MVPNGDRTSCGQLPMPGALPGIPSTKRRWPNLSCIVVILKLLVSILRTLSKSHATRRSGSSSKKGSETAKNTELNGQGASSFRHLVESPQTQELLLPKEQFIESERM